MPTKAAPGSNNPFKRSGTTSAEPSGDSEWIDKSDGESKKTKVDDTNPYYSSKINSYVKSQNYYKKFFQKKAPVMVKHDPPVQQPMIDSDAGSTTGAKQFFRNRNSVAK